MRYQMILKCQRIKILHTKMNFTTNRIHREHIIRNVIFHQQLKRPHLTRMNQTIRLIEPDQAFQ